MKILTLDGGGIRGYLSALVLENIENFLQENGLNEPLGKYFDLIAGTSTGAIIAGLLAIHKRASQIREIYEKDIPEIFSKKAKRSPISIGTKYKSDILRKKAIRYFKNEQGDDLTFADVKTHLLVTSIDITTMKLRLHKSKYNSSFSEREDETLSGAILSAVSAPSFFEVQTDDLMKHSVNLIDAGIVANNPSMLALADAFDFEDNDIKENGISLLSIGTGRAKQIPYNCEKLKNTQVGWVYMYKNGAVPIVEISMNAQSLMTEYQTEFFMKQFGYADGYRRINPDLTQSINLDDYKKIKYLKNLASVDRYDKEWIKKNLIAKSK